MSRLVSSRLDSLSGSEASPGGVAGGPVAGWVGSELDGALDPQQVCGNRGEHHGGRGPLHPKVGGIVPVWWPGWPYLTRMRARLSVTLLTTSGVSLWPQPNSS